MKNIAILSPTYSDAATLSADSEITTLPASNLQNMQPKRKWRTTGLTPYLLLDLGTSPPAANAMALIGHNLTGAATIRVRGKATSDVTTSPTVDTTAVSAWPASGKPSDLYWPHYLSWVAWSNDVALRYWRIDIADAGNTDGYLQAGRLIFGRVWRPTVNFDLGGTPLGRDQLDVQTRTDYGELFTERRNRSAPRRFALSITAANRDEVLDGIGEVQRLRGMWGDVACILDADATTHFHRHSMQGVFTAQQDHQFTPYFDASGECWTVNFPLREVI